MQGVVDKGLFFNHRLFHTTLEHKSALYAYAWLCHYTGLAKIRSGSGRKTVEILRHGKTMPTIKILEGKTSGKSDIKNPHLCVEGIMKNLYPSSADLGAIGLSLVITWERMIAELKARKVTDDKFNYKKSDKHVWKFSLLKSASKRFFDTCYGQQRSFPATVRTLIIKLKQTFKGILQRNEFSSKNVFIATRSKKSTPSLIEALIEVVSTYAVEYEMFDKSPRENGMIDTLALCYHKINSCLVAKYKNDSTPIRQQTLEFWNERLQYTKPVQELTTPDRISLKDNIRTVLDKSGSNRPNVVRQLANCGLFEDFFRLRFTRYNKEIQTGRRVDLDRFYQNIVYRMDEDRDWVNKQIVNKGVYQQEFLVDQNILANLKEKSDFWRGGKPTRIIRPISKIHRHLQVALAPQNHISFDQNVPITIADEDIEDVHMASKSPKNSPKKSPKFSFTRLNVPRGVSSIPARVDLSKKRRTTTTTSFFSSMSAAPILAVLAGCYFLFV
jgi:hypothetical protein